MFESAHSFAMVESAEKNSGGHPQRINESDDSFPIVSALVPVGIELVSLTQQARRFFVLSK